MPQSERIAEFLLSIGAVKLSVDPPFQWTSGIRAPIYCDNRMIYCHPEARDFVVESLVQRIKNLHIPADVIAGTATAAIGWAAIVADRMRMPFVYVRPKAKEHGAKKLIEGDLPPGKHIVLVEDLLSTGGSAMTSVETLRQEGEALVTDVVAIFSYELLSCLEAAQENRVKLHPLSTLSVLIETALAQDRISPQEAELIRTFAHDPEGWAQRAFTYA